MASRNISPAVARARGAVGGLSRDRADDDPDLVAARADLKAARLAEAIERAVASAPPLSDHQRHRLAQLLVCGAA